MAFSSRRSRRIVVRGRVFYWITKHLRDLCDDMADAHSAGGPFPPESSTLVVRPDIESYRVLRVHLGPSVMAWVVVTPGKVRAWVEHAMDRGWPDDVAELDADSLTIAGGVQDGGGAGGRGGVGGRAAGADDERPLPGSGRGRVDEERPA